jgi:hypothetical protein
MILKKSKLVSKFKQNDRENVIIESVFINFNHTGAITFEITNEHTLFLYSYVVFKKRH